MVRGTKSEAAVVIVKKRIMQHRSHRYSFRGGALFARIFHLFMEAELKHLKKHEMYVLSFSPNPTKTPARVRKKRKTGGPCLRAPRFWMFSLGNSYHLAKAMFARDTSRVAGSEARGEGRERGNLPGSTSKPSVAQRAGGIKG